MRSRAYIFASIVSLANLSTLARADASSHERALQKARQALEAFEIEEARRWLDVALTTKETEAEHARALDLLGALEGVETNYATAFRHFFLAAQLGGEESVRSVEHPQLATQYLAECAVRLSMGDLLLGPAEELLASANGIRADEDFEAKLKDVLFRENFVCPKIDKPPEPIALTPPPPPPGNGPEGLPTGRAEEVADKEGGGISPPPAATWILGGVALAAAGTGGVLGAVTWSEANDLRAPNFGPDLDSTQDLQTAANVAYATAGVAAVGAVLFWILDRGEASPSADVDVGPGAFAVRF